MSDSIYRQEAIDALDQILDRCEEIEAHLPKDDPNRTGYKMYPDYVTVWKYLHQLPTAEPEWIPVTERLPQYGNYLVSFKTDEEIDIGTYDPRTGLWSACDANGFYYVASKGLEVIAWAPLPKPYEGDKE